MEENQQYKISVFDKQYKSYEYTNIYTNCVVKQDEDGLDPAQAKLFSQDIFVKDSKDKIHILESPLRASSYIAGVLIIKDGRTYGRTKNQKRLLYKCIPDNNQYPAFLIPYEIKHGFSKSIENKYVLFKFSEWENNEKHPHGILTEVLGDVGCLKTYYEYRVYCKNLFIPMREFTQIVSSKTRENLDMGLIKNKYNVRQNTPEYVFTIDPEHTTDFDDALSITELYPNAVKISVHISNVAIILDHFELWKYISNRTSTIYLPDQPRHMLPSSLSQKTCSLIQGNERIVLSMEMCFNKETKEVYGVGFKNNIVSVSRNYVYEEKELLENEFYRMLYDTTRQIDSSVSNSHELVAYWMLRMNSECGKHLWKHKVGIYKTLTVNKNKEIPEGFSENVSRTICNWNNTISKYEGFGINLKHDLMNVDNYCHITSPIRRIVDIVNQLLFMKYVLSDDLKRSSMSNFSEDADNFCNKWMYKIEFINVNMKNIRKIQIDCGLLDRIEKNPFILNHTYQGVVFDRKHKHQMVHSHMVFIEELKILLQFNTTQTLENYQTYNFKLFVFECEDNIKRKIRLQLVE